MTPRFVLSMVTWAAATLIARETLCQAPPSITHSLPSAVAPGAATDVVIYGQNLQGAGPLWTSFAAEAALAPDIEKNGEEAGKATYRMTLPPDNPVGIVGLRVATGGGISNLHFLLVDDIPSLLDAGNNTSLENAQELTLPVAVDGACPPEAARFYKFTGSKDQRVSIEAVARRMGTLADPVIRLLDSQGRELAYSDDEPGLVGDCRLAAPLPADGPYFIEIRDIRYQGGANHRYRLRVGNFPLVSVTYPLAVQRGQKASVVPVSAAGDELPAIEVTAPDDAAAAIVRAGATLSGGQGSAMVTLLVTDVVETVESEPNDMPDMATAVTLPSGFSGRFDKPRDRDYYQFDVKKDQRYVFTGMARSLGSPSDLFMRLFNSDGGQLAEAEDAGASEGSINYTFPADGTYRLMVEDLHRRGGPGHAYRVEARAYEPGFSLSAEVDRASPPKSGVFVVKVTAARRDYADDITLSVDGAGDGLILSGNVIPKDKNDTVLNVTLPEAIEPGIAREISIVGTAKIGEGEFKARASTAAAVLKDKPMLAYVPQSFDGSLGLGVGPVFPAFFELSVEPSPPVFPQLVKTTTLTVKANRLNKFADPITLAVEGLPEGVTAKVAPIEKGKNEVAITLEGPEMPAEGETAIRITGAGTHQNQPKQVVLETILRTIKPLQVAAAPAGPIQAGGKQKIKITAVRYGGEKGPIALTLKNLPAGVTVPGDLTIAEGQNELEVELSAGAEAVVGKIENLVAAATTTVAGQEIAVESPPAALEVTAAP